MPFLLFVQILNNLIHVIYLQEYTTRSQFNRSRSYSCPYSGRCECPVKFRVVELEDEVMLQTVGKHTPECHAIDNVKRGFTPAQSGAIEGVVHANPMASGTEVRRTLNLQGRRDAVIYRLPSAAPFSEQPQKCGMRCCCSILLG